MSAARQGEGVVSDAIRAALALEPRLVLCRNSVGVLRSRGRVYHTGLGNGSPDLVGVLAGRAFALEIKAKGKIPDVGDVERVLLKIGPWALNSWAPSLRVGQLAPAWTPALKALDSGDRHVLEQEIWLAAWRGAGGFGTYVDGVESARAAVERARAGASS